MKASSSSLAGLAGASALVAAAAAAMAVAGAWSWEALAGAALLALPLYVVARDAAARRRPRPPWVPPWERSLHHPAMRRAPTR